MANLADFKLVLDTNVLVRGLVHPASASGRLLQICEDRAFRLLLSRAVLLEYRDVLTREELTHQHPVITPHVVAIVLERLRYVAEVTDPVRAHFRYDRDPNDECFIELAIAGKATHIVTHDNDLLSLAHDHSDAGKRFRQRLPTIKLVGPAALLRERDAQSHTG